jgi:hypothetical protein
MPSNSHQQQQQQQQQGEADEAGEGWGRRSMARPVRVSMSANAALSSRSRGSEEAVQ